MALLPPRSSFHPVPIGKLRPFHPAYTLLGRRSASHDTRFVAPAMKYHVEASSFESLAELQQTLGEARHLFFAHTLCPYAERVWLAFEETGKEAALVHVDLSKKPAWFREVSPNMLVPTVLHDGKVHVESMDILQWLLNDTVRSTSTISECVAACLDACGGNAGSWRVGSSISQRQVDALEHALKRTLSPDMRLVEKLAVYPFIYRTMAVLTVAYGVDIRTLCGGAVGDWIQEMTRRPSCMATSANPERFGKAMRDHGLDFFDYRTTSIFEYHSQAEENLV